VIRCAGRTAAIAAVVTRAGGVAAVVRSNRQEVAMRNARKNVSAHGSSTESREGSSSGYSPAQRDKSVPADEQIRMRAYELYLERGNGPGDEREDWLRAEREYRERSGDREQRGEIRAELSEP
jgi:hypothetical protein